MSLNTDSTLSTSIDSKSSTIIQTFEIESKPEAKESGDVIDLHTGAKIKESSNLQASFNLIKSFIGAGILTLPYSFKQTGLGLSIFGILGVGALTYYSLKCFLDVADNIKGAEKVSLQRLTKMIMGEKGKISVEISLFIMQVSCCIGLMIFANQFLNHAMCQFEFDSLCDNELFSGAFIFVLTVPLTLITNLHYFYITSFAAIIFVFVTILTQSIYNINYIVENGSDFGNQIMEFNVGNIPLFFGVANFAFEGTGIIFSIRASMSKPHEFVHVVKKQIGFLTVLYLLFPSLSLIALGSSLPEIVLLSLPSSNTFYLLIQVLYVISALLGYPVQLFPAVKMIENSRLLRPIIFDLKGRCINPIFRNSIRIFMVFVMMLIVFLSKSFNLFLNFMGSFVFTYVGFILPILIYNIHFEKTISPSKRNLNKFIMVLGTLLGIAGMVVSVQKMINYESEPTV